jgi:hypothetical protein
LADAQGQGTILNDDTPTFSFSQAAYPSDEAAHSVTLTVNRAGDPSLPANVNFATLDGTATERKDYTAAAGTLRFAAGETSKTFDVLLTDDSDLAVCRINVSAAFFQSIEFQETGYLVYRTYKAAYGDATSPGVAGTVPVVRLQEFLPDTRRIGEGVRVGIGDWKDVLEANKNAYLLEFVQRPRFLTAYPQTMTPAEFVDKLNANAGGVLDATERANLINELAGNNTNAGRAGVLRKVAEDSNLVQAELRRAFVLMQYYGYLRRNPDDAPEPGLNFAGWSFWLGKLNEFNGNFVQAEMVKAFLDSGEYRNRFGN